MCSYMLAYVCKHIQFVYYIYNYIYIYVQNDSCMYVQSFRYISQFESSNEVDELERAIQAIHCRFHGLVEDDRFLV